MRFAPDLKCNIVLCRPFGQIAYCIPDHIRRFDLVRTQFICTGIQTRQIGKCAEHGDHCTVFQPGLFCGILKDLGSFRILMNNFAVTVKVEIDGVERVYTVPGSEYVEIRY